MPGTLPLPGAPMSPALTFNLSMAQSIARIRYPELDLAWALRLASTHDASALLVEAEAADRAATELYELSDDYADADDLCNARQVRRRADAESDRAGALRAAADLFTHLAEK